MHPVNRAIAITISFSRATQDDFSEYRIHRFTFTKQRVR